MIQLLFDAVEVSCILALVLYVQTHVLKLILEL